MEIFIKEIGFWIPDEDAQASWLDDYKF